MAFRFLNNAIITGYVDAYCLICESHLRSMDDMFFHITKPIHVKNLNEIGYYDVYKADFIRKTNKIYFCELCNTLLSTAVKVDLHVAEPKHIANKDTQRLKRIGATVTAYDSLIIDEKSWNGIDGSGKETCEICDTEFQNENIHKTEADHIIKMITSKVIFCLDKDIYRRIDENCVQCLTCNKVVAPNTIIEHFAHPDHKKLYSECREAYIKAFEKAKSKVQSKQTETKVIPAKIVKEKPAIKEEKPIKQEVKTEIVKTQKETEVAKISTIPMPEVSVKKPSFESPKTPEVKKSKQKLVKPALDIEEEICKVLNAKDYMTVDDKGKKWCLICDWTMDDCAAETHVRLKHHQVLLKMHKARLARKGQGVDDTAKEETFKLNPDPKAVSDFEKNDSQFDCGAVSKQRKHSVDEHKVDKKEEIKKSINTKNVNNNNSKNANINDTKNMNKNEPKSANINETKNANITNTKNANIYSKNLNINTKNVNINNIKDVKKPQSPTIKKAPSIIEIHKEKESRASSASSRNDDGEKTKNKRTKTKKQAENAEKTFKTKPFENKTAMKVFAKDVVAVENEWARDVIVNQEYVVNYYSFFVITCLNKMRCELCDLDLESEQVETHKVSRRHQNEMGNAMVVTENSEFIREIRPEVYHCGYCNIVEVTNEELEKHLGSTCHREAKTSSLWRLHHYVPRIAKYREVNRPKILGDHDILKIEISSEA